MRTARQDDLPTRDKLATAIAVWARHARRGDRHVYASTDTGFAERSAEVAAAHKLQLAGVVLLVQRRIRCEAGLPTGRLEYIAIRSGR